MKTLIHYCFLVIVSLLLSCSSGKQDLQRGNYEGSVKKSIDRLRSNPGNKKAQETLQQAYPLTVNFHKNKVANAKASSKQFKWEDILDSYLKLNAIYNDLQRCPTCLSLINNPQNFTNEAEEARTSAAEDRYNAGIIDLDLNEREAAKRAYHNFKRADQLKRNYKDVQIKIKEALNIATIKVVIEQVPAPFNLPDVQVDYFNEKLVEYIKTNKKPNNFVRLYSAREAMDANIQSPDQYVMMTFQNYSRGRSNIRETVENASRDSVIIGQVDVDGVKKDVYGTVSAKVTVYDKTLRINGTLSMQIMDGHTNQARLQEQFPNEYIWSNKWGNFNGDERALTTEQKQICNEKERPLPTDRELFIEFSKPIFNQVTTRIRNFYRNQ